MKHFTYFSEMCGKKMAGEKKRGQNFNSDRPFLSSVAQHIFAARNLAQSLSVPRVWLRSALGAALVLLPLMLAPSAFGYFSTMDTGEVVAKDQYRFSIEPQILLNKYDGGNVVARLDTGLNPDTSIRAILGFGTVDFQTGVMAKYVPYPATKSQPAIGAMAGVLLSRVGGGTEFSLRFHPLISQKFEFDYGEITPYGSIPFGVSFRSNDTFVPIQLAGGAEWRPLNYDRLHFLSELGLNINKSFSYFSLGLAYYFDEHSLKRRK